MTDTTKILNEINTIVSDAIASLTKIKTQMNLENTAMPANFIIARDMPAEYGESPAMFNAERFEEYCRTYGEPEYETEEATLDDVIEWLAGLNKEGQNFILRNAEITDHEYRYIKAALS